MKQRLKQVVYSMRRYLPRTLTDWLAFFFMSVMVHVIAGFELFIVLPAIYSHDPHMYPIHVAAGLFIYANVLANLILTMTTDSTSGSVILPSVLKPGWRFCMTCEHNAPPRSFHCEHCAKCILKRDHHCVFTGNCIGYANQRYFLALVFYVSLGAIYTNILNFDYTWEVLGTINMRVVFTMVMPFMSWFLGYAEGFTFAIAFVTTTCLVGALLMISLLVYHMMNILNGQTTYERTHNIRDFDHGWKENLVDALGRNWYCCLLFPLIPSPPKCDGINFKKFQGYKDLKDM